VGLLVDGMSVSGLQRNESCEYGTICGVTIFQRRAYLPPLLHLHTGQALLGEDWHGEDQKCERLRAHGVKRGEFRSRRPACGLTVIF
jgi:hypothetical protein